MRYLKKAIAAEATVDAKVTETVQRMLEEIEAGGEDRVKHYNKTLDGWQGNLVLPLEELAAAAKRLPDSVKDDLVFARDRVRDFAKRQREAMQEFEVESSPGVIVGQRLIPVNSAGCYVPGGRYAHAASAIMSVCTATEANVVERIAATPAHGREGAHPAILYAMQLSGVSHVLMAGGVQGVASLAFGIGTGHAADVIVGPGNGYVAEAKRQLFGRVGIDVLAGPTENMIIADETADPHMVATDLVGQAEHGNDSPVWLITTSETLANEVSLLVPELAAALPEPACTHAANAWRDFGEIILVEDRNEACEISDQYAPEHLQVMAADLDWWLKQLRNYGSLFLGEETNVTYGDKCAGTNHILPTRGAARYTGGLSVAKFIKVVTYQRMTKEGSATIAEPAARISRLEGMEGHARSGDARIEKYFPDRNPQLSPAAIDWPAADK